MVERKKKEIRCSCGKLLARAHDDGKIMVWCKYCKKEVELDVAPLIEPKKTQ